MILSSIPRDDDRDHQRESKGVPLRYRSYSAPRYLIILIMLSRRFIVVVHKSPTQRGERVKYDREKERDTYIYIRETRKKAEYLMAVKHYR